MEPQAHHSPSPSPSPSPHRLPPGAEGGGPVDPHPPLEPTQQPQEQQGAGGDWSELPLSTPQPHSTTVFFSNAATYVPPRSAERAAADPGRRYGGDGQSWYSWNGGRTKDRRRATPPPARPHPQPHPQAPPPPARVPIHPQAPPPPARVPIHTQAPPPPARVPMHPQAPPPPPASVPNSSVQHDHRFVPDIMTRKRRTAMLQRTAMVARAAAAVLCLAALVVLAADSRKGWALDSYSNYTQLRYSEAVNVIGFLYSVFQLFALAAFLRRNRHLIPPPKGDYFDFTMDQVLAYLLISSSSSATAAVGDWIDNWGSDPFPTMANSSIAISFLAFVVFAINSLISAYNLFRRDL